MSKKREELKPCPFCGSEDVALGYDNERDKVDLYPNFVKCQNCQCASLYSIGEKGAIEAWNTRDETPLSESKKREDEFRELVNKNSLLLETVKMRLKKDPAIIDTVWENPEGFWHPCQRKEK
jgi:Lar family restriction alleviation protein